MERQYWVVQVVLHFLIVNSVESVGLVLKRGHDSKKLEPRTCHSELEMLHLLSHNQYYHISSSGKY